MAEKKQEPRKLPNFGDEVAKAIKNELGSGQEPATANDINETINRDRALKYKWLSKHFALRKDGTMNDLIEFFDMQRLADATRDERLFELLEKGKEAEQMERDEPDEDITWIEKTLAGLAAALLIGIPALVAGFTAGLAAQVLSMIKGLGKLFKTLGGKVFKGLQKIFPKIFGKGSKLFKTFDKIRDLIKGFGQSIGKLGKTFPKVVNALKMGFGKFATLLKSVGSFFVRFLGLGKELKNLTKDGKKFAEFFGDIKRFFTGKLAKAFSGVKGVFKSIGKYAKIVAKVAKFFANFGKILGKVFLPITVLITLFDVAKGAAEGYKEGGFLGAITGGAKALFNSLITSVVDTVVHWGGKLVAFIANFFGFSELAAKVTAATANFSLGEVFENIYNGIKGIFGKVSDFISGAVEGIKMLPEKIIAVLGGLKNSILGLGQSFAGLFEGFDLGMIFEGIKMTISGGIDALVGGLSSIGSSILSAFEGFDIGELIGKVGEAVSNSFGKIKEFFAGFGGTAGGKVLEKLKAIGSSIIDSVISPAKSIFDAIVDSITGLINLMKAGLYNLLSGVIEAIPSFLRNKLPEGFTGFLDSLKPEEEATEASIPKLAEGGRIEGTPQGILANIGEQNVSEIVTPEKNITAINTLISTEAQQTQALLNSLLEKTGGEGSVNTTINKTNNNVITPTAISPRSNESTMGRINAMAMTG